MKTLSLSDAKTQLPRLVQGLRRGPVVLTRRGQPCAAIVGLDAQFDLEAFSLSQNPKLRDLIDHACRCVAEGGGIPFAQIEAEVAAREKRQRKKRR